MMIHSGSHQTRWTDTREGDSIYSAYSQPHCARPLVMPIVFEADTESGNVPMTVQAEAYCSISSTQHGVLNERHVQ